jgi:hypothetical protein
LNSDSRILLAAEFNKPEEAFRAARWPAKLQSFAKHLVDTRADFILSKEFPSAKLVQVARHPLAERCVMPY